MEITEHVDLSQAGDSDLTAIAALSTTSYGRNLLTLADAAAGRTVLALGTAATHAHGDYDIAGAAAAAQAASQPLDSDLTAIAALSTTTFGRALLALADAAAVRAAIGAISDTAYAGSWDGVTDVAPSKNAVYDKIQALSGASVPSTNEAATIVSKTTTYVAVAGDMVLANATGGAFTVTLPAATLGYKVRVKKTDSSVNAVTVAPASGTIDGRASTVIGSQYESHDFVSDGTNWFEV